MSAKIMPLQPPRQLESLDDLLAQAAHYAGFCMRNNGKMSPTLFLIGADGPLMFVPASLVDADEKDAFATTARLVGNPAKAERLLNWRRTTTFKQLITEMTRAALAARPASTS